VYGDDEEFLVLLDDSRAESARVDLRAAGRVTQMASPRLLLVTTDRGRSIELQSRSDVVGVFDDVLPAELAARLNEAETLFADAWATRRSASPKQRIGDGRNWGDEHFEPPDPPSTRRSRPRTRTADEKKEPPDGRRRRHQRTRDDSGESSGR
jgi:hypothetical protein